MLIGLYWLAGCTKSDGSSYAPAGRDSTGTPFPGTYATGTDSVNVAPAPSPRVLLGTDKYYGATYIFSIVQDRCIAHDSVLISRYTGDSIVMLTSNFQLSSRQLTWIMFGGDTTVKNDIAGGETHLALMIRPQPNTLKLIGTRFTHNSFKELISFQFSGKRMD